MSQVSEIFSARCDFDHFRVSFFRDRSMKQACWTGLRLTRDFNEIV